MTWAAIIAFGSIALLSLHVASKANRRARTAQHDIDAFAHWFLARYEIDDEPAEFELVEADVGYLTEN
jgi:hypothetical protein